MSSPVSLFSPKALSLPAYNGIGILRPNQYIEYTRTYIFLIIRLPLPGGIAGSGAFIEVQNESSEFRLNENYGSLSDLLKDANNGCNEGLTSK